jgi:hypothetical protein
VSLSISTLSAAVVGIIIGLAFGFKCPKFWFFPGFQTKPCTQKIVIPSLIGMVLMGMIARNFFGEIMEPFPSIWSQYIKSICLSLLLIRGGLQVKFKGQGKITVLLALVP